MHVAAPRRSLHRDAELRQHGEVRAERRAVRQAQPGAGVVGGHRQGAPHTAQHADRLRRRARQRRNGNDRACVWVGGSLSPRAIFKQSFSQITRNDLC